ncbi:MAG: CvpA family protein, partial [Bacteroidota bacterium]
IVSLATIAALILGIYVAVHFSNFLNALLADRFHPSANTLPILSFVFTFILVVIGVIIVAKLTEKFADVIGLGFLNRIGGAVLGLIKGVILASVLIFLLNYLDPHSGFITAKDKKGSYCYTKISTVFPEMMKMFGGEIKFPKW